jgi:DNA-binding GntR family transcriptional regulator
VTTRPEHRVASDLNGSVVRVPQRSMLADEVYEILRDSLLSGRFAPGSRLNLDQLARELHVSNTPVRQALARLESEGLTTKEPYRGFAASPLLDSRTIAEGYEYRMLIEPPTAARAAQRHGSEGLTVLEALCHEKEVRQLIADPARQEDIGERDIQFHAAIAREAGNNFIRDNLVAALTRLRIYAVYHRSGAGEQAWDEHRAILAAIRDRDPKGAAAAMRAHLSNSRKRLGDAISLGLG